jgi:hypothetical protein
MERVRSDVGGGTSQDACSAVGLVPRAPRNPKFEMFQYIEFAGLGATGV